MLAENLKVLLATTFSFYVKAKNFHWNVEGSNFPQYHKLFDDIAGDTYDSIDRVAEYIRILGSYTPGSLTRYVELSGIEDQTKIPRAELMVAELIQDNEIMIEFLKQLFSNANDVNQQGIANFIAERLDAHGKWGWQLKSITKKDRE